MLYLLCKRVTSSPSNSAYLIKVLAHPVSLSVLMEIAFHQKRDVMVCLTAVTIQMRIVVSYE